ncbi:MAG: Transcriptional regulatory protein DegU [Chroococcidiopsis cubana SAG 39.79]|uniref:DNA-binding response regulator n=1 Tax=Chroococcidiopsis cubana SAG 39.79 TaxID=388085 RepID=A0AB37UB21_9CYAN|nr:response regulator transcription factor [Chroococcidiopsis cubana]MDZ4876942.1 Transcriptional regulatory protein DegU [Chroococcidiopsis cubana SAG 39.79]RUT02646.1 DNA-binding response regulator [Chroococcidiopsis cubana SAG 39.79]
MSPCLRLLLVEDDELFRLGLEVKLQQESGIEIVAEAVDGETAVEMVQRHVLDVVLLDVGLPGIGGVEACRQIKQQNPQLPVLVLTSHSQKSLIARLIAAGAAGYCLKGIAAETLILAIRSVASGASWWDRTATTEIRTTFDRNLDTSEAIASTAKTIPPLTQREQEILALIAAGKSNQEIAATLYITPGTVRVHVHTIIQKLGVRDRTQAAVLAIQKKLGKQS